jgi:hypothetical protein
MFGVKISTRLNKDTRGTSVKGVWRIRPAYLDNFIGRGRLEAVELQLMQHLVPCFLKSIFSAE